MNLTKSAIENNRVTLVLVCMLVLLGLMAFNNLPKAQDPGFTLRTAVVTTQLAGASPERVEQLVTDKIETKIQEMPELDFLTSESRKGISIVYVNFKERYTAMRPIFDDLRRKIEDVTKELPEGITGPSVNDEFGDVFGSVYSLTGEGFNYVELKQIADEIRDTLLKQPDIAKVNLHGAQQEVVFIDYNNARLTELGLSPQQLSNTLSSVNTLSAGGSIISGRERIALEPTGNYESITELKRTVVELPSGDLVYLEDIATVYRGYIDPPESFALVNGKPAIAIAISMTEGSDILKLGNKLDQLMPELAAQYPWGIEINKIWFQASLVNDNVNSFVSNLFQAIAIVVLVMIAFLGPRTGFVVAALIPSAIVITFFVMEQVAITINQVSLAALIIALGLLVDNAIVMVESILVKREQGLSATEAAIQAGNELKFPLLTSSLTTGFAFMPIALAESAVGEYTSDIFYVVTITLLVSWLLAMTFIPMITTVMLKTPASKKIDAIDTFDTTPEFTGQWYRLYRHFLILALKNRLLSLAGVAILFTLAFYSIKFVPKIFIEPSGDPVFTGKLELPLGTSIETSRAVVDDINKILANEFYSPGDPSAPLQNWLVFIGEGGPRVTLGIDPPNPNAANAFLIANTDDSSSVMKIISRLSEHLFTQHPDLAFQLSRLENGPPVGYPIQIRIAGDGVDNLYHIADTITEHLYQVDGVSSVKNSWGLQTKKLLVDVDQERARRAGVTSADVAYSLQTSLSGIDLTQYREGDQLIPVTLRTLASDREDIGKLDGMSIYSQAATQSVPLKQVADVKLAFEPGIIERRDRSRTLTLLVQLDHGRTASEINVDLIPWLQNEATRWPKNYRYTLGGESEESASANQAILAKVPLAVMAILLLLVGQFNSVRRPLIILATIPLGLIGVVIGLLVAQSSLGFFTFLGIISLSGIIINNAIVLLDRINIEIEQMKKSASDAIVHSCQQRLRPIMLTMATTTLGMTPLWWGGTAMFKPMAIAIIFGLAFATLLTLFVVPVLYSILFRVRFS